MHPDTRKIKSHQGREKRENGKIITLLSKMAKILRCPQRSCKEGKGNDGWRGEEEGGARVGTAGSDDFPSILYRVIE